MRGLSQKLATLGLLTTAYASQEQVVFDAYPHQSVTNKNVAIIGMTVLIMYPDTL